MASMPSATMRPAMPSAAETRVNTTTANDQWDAAVAALSDGGYVVTWMSNARPGWLQHGIYAQRYDANGNAVGSETRVNTTTAGGQEVLPWPRSRTAATS